MRLYQIEKAFVQWRKSSTKWKGNLMNWKRYLQIIYPVKCWCLNWIKKVNNSISKNPNNPMNKGTVDLNTSFSISSVAQSCLTLCDPMNCSTPGLPGNHQLLEFTQTHIRPVGDAIQTSHPLSSPFPPAPNPSQHQSLFQWVNSSHEVDKVLDRKSVV